MAGVEDNRRRWAAHDWSGGGEEWSTLGGGSERWWHGILLPRLLPLLATMPDEAHVVEIGPGYGRWTRFLLEHAARLTLVDIDGGCLEACRQRFGRSVRTVAGDGHTLAGPGARVVGPVDLVFSYESLVHAEVEVLGSYLRECARVLRPGGVGFIHHSNLGALLGPGGEPPDAPTHWRSPSVDAAAVRERALAAGLAVPLQELCTKGGPRDRVLLDCITVFRRPADGPPWREADGAAQTAVVENGDFWREIRALGRTGRAYDAAIDPLHHGLVG